MLAPQYEPVDGFLYSGSMLMLPSTYRANVIAQMEVLRLAKGYRPRWYPVPELGAQSIPAYSQYEKQVRVQPGGYLWALSLSAPFNDTDDDDPAYLDIQITDACTRTKLFSDYIHGSSLVTSTTEAGRRAPMILTPRLITEPSHFNVEIYNRASVAIQCQLVLLMSEPILPPEELLQELARRGIELPE